jgi:hypothetical protein
MSASRSKRIPPLVGVGKSGDKSVDKRDFLCTRQWINCGYLQLFSGKSLKAQVSSVTSPYKVVYESK